MVTQILDEYRTACKVVLLEHQTASPASCRPAFVVRTACWFSTEEEAKQAFTDAVRAHTKRHKRTGGADSETDTGKAEKPLKRNV